MQKMHFDKILVVRSTQKLVKIHNNCFCRTSLVPNLFNRISRHHKDIQLIQSKLVRVLSNVKLSDHKTTKSLLTNIDMPSVNQLNAQIKITEIWKAVHVENYPIEVKKYKLEREERVSRSKTSEKLILTGYIYTFINNDN